MIMLNYPQGSGAWAQARLGIPTASRFDQILTPKTMKLSDSSKKLMWELLAEQVLGVPMDGASSGFMQRGEVLEKHAVDYYEMQRGVDTEPGGVILTDDRRAGCSPDRIVGLDGLLEIKCPSPANHIGYMLDPLGIGYRCQVQGQLWVAEREWVDTISYHPEMPTVLVRQVRDEAFIKALAAAVHQFNEMIEDSKALLKKLGYFPDLDVPDLKIA